MSDKSLPTRALLYMSSRHLFIRLTRFMRISNSMRIIHKASLLTESLAFLKSINNWCTASLYSHSFTSICRIQNIWSVVDPLRWNPLRWFPVTSSSYGVNFNSRMLDKMLYVLDRNAMHRNYYNQFYHPSFILVQRSTPSTPQKIPPCSKFNLKFLDLRADCSTSCFNQFSWNLISTKFFVSF